MDWLIPLSRELGGAITAPVSCVAAEAALGHVSERLSTADDEHKPAFDEST